MQKNRKLMNISLLVSILTPCLPFLTKAAESASEQIGSDTWEGAKKIWAKLSPKIENNVDAKDAAEKLAARPESEGRKAVFKEELESILKENPALAEEIAQIMAEMQNDSNTGVQINQTSTGDKNQTIGQVSGGKQFANIEGSVTINE